jgi:hypothetical protein
MNIYSDVEIESELVYIYGRRFLLRGEPCVQADNYAYVFKKGLEVRHGGTDTENVPR